ncbi:MAG: SURF1 family protein [Pseudorhodobacter sp.]
MLKRMIVPLILGMGGVAILLWLGFWQLQRLHWKEDVLAQIEARIAAAPVALPANPEDPRDRYMPVRVSGRFTGEDLGVLTSIKQIGPGYRVIALFETDNGRRIMIDRGFVAEAARGVPREVGQAEITGNLHWPQEVDGYTPDPDLARGLFFARDVPQMAEALKAEPVLIVARSDTGDGIEPMPVGAEGITNNHLNYAITWFLMAAVWLGMTLLLLWRIRRTKQ